MQRTVVFAFFTIALLGLLPIQSVTAADSEFKNEITLSSGDYIEMRGEYSGLYSLMVENSDGDLLLINENKPSILNISHDGRICQTTSDQGCEIVIFDEVQNYTVHTSSDVGLDNDQFIRRIHSRAVYTSSGLESWDNTVVTTEEWFSIDGVDYHWEEIETEDAHTIEENKEPKSISVGDTWSVTQHKNSTIMVKSRLNGGDWEYNETSESETTTDNYEALIESSVFIDQRKYDTLKIKMQELGTDMVMHAWIDSDGLPLKMELLLDNEVMSILTLTKTNWTLDKEDNTVNNSPLTGFTTMLATSAIVMASIVKFGSRK